jgi:hypothetical protein
MGPYSIHACIICSAHLERLDLLWGRRWDFGRVQEASVLHLLQDRFRRGQFDNTRRNAVSTFDVAEITDSDKVDSLLFSRLEAR